jgi:hypothetical protein
MITRNVNCALILDKAGWYNEYHFYATTTNLYFCRQLENSNLSLQNEMVHGPGTICSPGATALRETLYLL